MRKQIMVLAIAVILTAAIVLIAVMAGSHISTERRSETYSNTNSSTFTNNDIINSNGTTLVPAKTINDPMPDANSIKIPGFEKITLVGGQSKQKVSLYNPEENSCFFLVSLRLPDGTEFYRSNLIALGDSIKEIQLERVLSPGVYENSLMQYSCFSVDDLSAMNGANVKFLLEVK